MKRLEGRIAIISGGGSGIGEEIAYRFSEEGAKTVIADISESNAKRVSETIVEKGGESQFIKTDVTNDESIKKCVDQVVRTYGGIDVLVNSAGLFLQAPIIDTTNEIWDRTIEVGLKGTFLFIRAIVPEMIKKKSGKIINIASNAAAVGFPDSSAYCAMKAGVVGLTKALAVELAQYKINVNAIGPCNVRTPLNKHLMDNPKFYQFMIDNTPWGRVSETTDISPAAAYLASDEADYVTGHTLYIDGGWLAR